MNATQKMVYAQSSDIKSRTFLEYRRDMKRKAIAELEFQPYLTSLLMERYKDESLTLKKFGGDAHLWFGRSGAQVTQEPDYCVELSTGETHYYEFQYAEETENLKYFDFKVSKVGKKKRGLPRAPHKDREFFYVIKPERKYAFLSCEWVMRNGIEASVPAWGSRPAYRVPRELFLKQFKSGSEELDETIARVYNKNRILNFQHQFLNNESQRLSRALQQVIDEEKLIQIMPGTLDGFFHVCFILDKIQKVPNAATVWLVYLLSFFQSNMKTLDFARWMYSLDFLYFKCSELKDNELRAIVSALGNVQSYIANNAKEDGSFTTDPYVSPIEETRQMLFSVNLFEDLRQDMAITWGYSEQQVNKIYSSIPSVKQTAEWIRSAS